MAASGMVERWRQLPRRQQRLLIGFCAAAAVGLSDLTVWRPLRAHAQQLGRQVEQGERQLVESLVAGSQAEEVAAAFAAYQPYLMPSGSPDAVLATVLTEVETAVREAGAMLINLRPTEETASADDSVAVLMEGEAGSEQLVRLLDRLQRSPQLLRVSELTVRVVEGSLLRTTMVIEKLLLPSDGASGGS